MRATADVAAGGKMDAGAAGLRSETRVAVQQHTCCEGLCQAADLLGKRHLLGRCQVLLAHRDPATAPVERRCDDIGERPARLPAIGDQEDRRGGKVHRDAYVPIRPSSGLDGSA